MMFQGFGFGGAGFGGIFLETYRCYSIATCGKKDKEKGDKIILPASAFERLGMLKDLRYNTNEYNYSTNDNFLSYAV